MSVDKSNDTPLTSRAQLIEALEKGNKPKSEWKIGTEHEKFPFYDETFKPVPYEGDQGIGVLLEKMRACTPSEEIKDGEALIGLALSDGGAISLEPGGQFELSGAPLDTLHQTCNEIGRHLSCLRAAAQPLGINLLGLGASPLWALDEVPIMPKQRYAIMRNYMPRVGTQGLNMMFRSCTVQVNLDFSSERDMVQKMRVALALQPLATALFSASPFLEGRPTGYLSTRGYFWQDVDKARTGMLPFVFEEGFGFERYVDWALDVPLYFLKRGDTYHDVSGASFRDLLAGHFTRRPGATATEGDWQSHLSTLFPEARLKSFIEMRGADGGPHENLCALSAFWVGMLYHQSSLDGASDLIRGWTEEARGHLHEDVLKEGLKATIGGRQVMDILTDCLNLSEEGLKARNHKNSLGDDERVFLKPLWAILDRKETLAEKWLRLYHSDWQSSVMPVFKDSAYW